MAKDLEQDNLSEIVADNSIVVVQYMAGWCGNCRLMKPKFKKLAGENTQAIFMMVDMLKNIRNREKWLL